MEIPDKLYFKIGEVSQICGVEPFTLRYWETEFPALNPERRGSKQRLYRKEDVELVLKIKQMLYRDKFTIAGARRRLSGRGGSTEGVEETGAEEKEERKLEAEAIRIFQGLLKETSKELNELRKILQDWKKSNGPGRGAVW